MTSFTARFRPPNSVILIADDSEQYEIPDSMYNSIISATDSCIAVGCKPEVDGDTQIIIGKFSDVHPDSEPAFSGVLKTPSRSVRLKSVLGETILSSSVDGRSTKISIWINDASEPDQIIIGHG